MLPDDPDCVAAPSAASYEYRLRAAKSDAGGDCHAVGNCGGELKLGKLSSGLPADPTELLLSSLVFQMLPVDGLLCVVNSPT
ncbi:hypothetical protein ACS49_00225 [Bacillus cereus]|nr:hypothetical protein ACS49_00225 [Bacillus cereus]